MQESLNVGSLHHDLLLCGCRVSLLHKVLQRLSLYSDHHKPLKHQIILRVKNLLGVDLFDVQAFLIFGFIELLSNSI